MYGCSPENTSYMHLTQLMVFPSANYERKCYMWDILYDLKPKRGFNCMLVFVSAF